MSTHMSTVAGNEMLVLDSAKRFPNAEFFGLNPGLLATNIRSNLSREGSLGYRFMEWMIRETSPTPDEYAGRLAPLPFSPELSGHTGALFDRKGNPIRPSPKLTDPVYVDAFLREAEALAARGRQTRS
jgi:hypothetical protein